MCSRSSSRRPGDLLTVGRVAGHRGRRGEVTVRVPGGEAEIWTEARRVWIGDGRGGGRDYEVERSRAYRDRLVLKLRGIDDGNSAAGLRGRRVAVRVEDAPEPPEGRYYRARLVGLLAIDERGQELGEVVDVVPTQGHDLLRITRGAGAEDEREEMLVPCVPEIVRRVDFAAGRVSLRLPPGLRELNRR